MQNCEADYLHQIRFIRQTNTAYETSQEPEWSSFSVREKLFLLKNFYVKMRTMETMTLTISVPPNIGALLKEKAKNEGKDVAEYVEDLIEKDVDRAQTLDEILAPIRRNFAESGMTEEDLDALVESERQAMREEKNAR